MAQLDNTTPISNSMYYTGPIEPGMQILSIYFGPSNWPNWIITAHFQEEEKKNNDWPNFWSRLLIRNTPVRNWRGSGPSTKGLLVLTFFGLFCHFCFVFLCGYFLTDFSGLFLRLT